ncbi:uncharacterized protein CCR75_005095 [Bremia lactucae]|uniref:Uncharacterized protein n=1 Tax=Bremia lactucae TaxID=4779 RepID=A0A976FPQ9_BRELC|nr:hypothetical protein CCR75_005095 [Bremia lactucae]
MTSRTDEEVYLVENATLSTCEVRIMTDEERKFSIMQRSMDEILYIASMVAQHQIPMDVVNTILELAGVLIAFQAETWEFCHGRSNMNEKYLQLKLPKIAELKLPPGVDVSECSLLVVDVASKDQGWATDRREHNGTYCASSSWCELVLTSTNSIGDSEETDRVVIWPNLRAGSTFRHHRKYFDKSTKLLTNIKLGDCASIVLRSQYPGWTNSAKYGWLAICFGVKLNDNFLFANIPFPESAARREESANSSISCCIQ